MNTIALPSDLDDTIRMMLETSRAIGKWDETEAVMRVFCRKDGMIVSEPFHVLKGADHITSSVEGMIAVTGTHMLDTGGLPENVCKHLLACDEFLGTALFVEGYAVPIPEGTTLNAERYRYALAGQHLSEVPGSTDCKTVFFAARGKTTYIYDAPRDTYDLYREDAGEHSTMAIALRLITDMLAIHNTLDH